MVAIVAGAGLGLLETTALAGAGSLGQVNGTSAVNLTTGNLVLQFSDETLAGSAGNLNHLRTYNALGNRNDGDADQWRWLGEKRILGNDGEAQISRITGDGHTATYTRVGNVYVSAEGGGADDTIRFDAENNQWVWTEGTSKVEERYDVTSGWIISSRDTSGHGFDYTFVNDLLTRVTDVISGQAIELIYGTQADGNANGKLLRVDTLLADSNQVSTLLRQVSYSYYDSGLLHEVRTDLDPRNTLETDVYVTTYSYKAGSSYVETITQSDGTTASYTYYDDGKLESVTDAAGTTSFTYNNLMTVVSNGENEVSLYSYNSDGYITQVVNGSGSPDATVMDYTYYPNSNNVHTVTNGDQVITYTYDGNSNLLSETDTLGNQITYTYSENLLQTETRYVEGEAQTIRYVYDGQLLRFVISAEGFVSESRYNALGQVTQSIQYSRQSYSVDGLNHSFVPDLSTLEAWVNGIADKSTIQLTEFGYDHLGHVIRQVSYSNVDSQGSGILDDQANVSEYVYNSYGELTQTIEGSNQSIVTDGLTLNFDASSAQQEQILWRPESNSSVTNFVFDTRDDQLVNTSSKFAGILKAYEFSGGRIELENLNGNHESLADLPGDPSRSSGSFEIWFKADDLNDHDVLYETGGSWDGLSITLNGTILGFDVKNRSDSVRITNDLADFGIDPTEDFVQVVGVVNDRGNVLLYANGQLLHTDTTGVINDWAGGDPSGLGAMAGGVPFAGADRFEGTNCRISLLRTRTIRCRCNEQLCSNGK